MRQVKVPKNKSTYKIAKNRYKTRLNQQRANAWQSMNKQSWVNCLSKIVSLVHEKDKPTLDNDADDLELYKYFRFKNEKGIPDEYKIRSRFTRIDGKKQRVYKLVKAE